MTSRNTDANALVAAAQAMRSAQRITAVCHENPDADTVAGAIAVALMADRLGIESEVVSADDIPPVFAFLPRFADVIRRPTLAPDLAVFCDAATLERVGRVAREDSPWLSAARVLNVDHHVSNSCFGEINLVDATASATCEVLVDLVDELGLELDTQLATALLTGIVRDSHGFADRSTSGRTLRAAARLVEAGAPLVAIHRSILAELPYPTMALWGRMLARMERSADGRLVYTTLTQQMLDETGTQQHDADGLVEFMANVQGADVVLLLRETGADTTRVSVRVIGSVDATQIVAPFGGGGHAQRAGCSVRADLATAVERVVEVATRSLG